MAKVDCSRNRTGCQPRREPVEPSTTRRSSSVQPNVPVMQPQVRDRGSWPRPPARARNFHASTAHEVRPGRWQESRVAPKGHRARAPAGPSTRARRTCGGGPVALGPKPPPTYRQKTAQEAWVQLALPVSALLPDRGRPMARSAGPSTSGWAFCFAGAKTRDGGHGGRVAWALGSPRGRCCGGIGRRTDEVGPCPPPRSEHSGRPQPDLLQQSEPERLHILVPTDRLFTRHRLGRDRRTDRGPPA